MPRRTKPRAIGAKLGLTPSAFRQEYEFLKDASLEVWVGQNAHLPLITEEQARQILEIRRNRKRYYGRQQRVIARSNGSDFILSGGVFRCSRCGSNMVGKKSKGYKYYVSGSVQYRRGRGCGAGA